MWKRWPNSSADCAKNNPGDTKWALALTAHSSLETISPIMHMTCVSGMVSNKGCIMNSPALWTPHSDNALQPCQARRFNGLISETIIVNTSQRRCLEHRGEVAQSALVVGGRSYGQTISMTEPPRLRKRRNIGDMILNETVQFRLTAANLNKVAANCRTFSYIHTFITMVIICTNNLPHLGATKTFDKPNQKPGLWTSIVLTCSFI